MIVLDIATVEQAEAFLGVEKGTPDDFVISLYTSKVCKPIVIYLYFILYSKIQGF